MTTVFDSLVSRVTSLCVSLSPLCPLSLLCPSSFLTVWNLSRGTNNLTKLPQLLLLGYSKVKGVVAIDGITEVKKDEHRRKSIEIVTEGRTFTLVVSNREKMNLHSLTHYPVSIHRL
jgi:hypothetical protein